MSDELTKDYAEKIQPLLPLAQKAYGSRDQNTPAHVASKEYTRLLQEYVDAGGSLLKLSELLQVSYSGIRRRVFTAKVPPMKSNGSRKKPTQPEIDEAVARVREARSTNTARYHEQLSIEYFQNGISLSYIAKGLGIANAGPLYYGVQRHSLRASRTA